MRFLPNPHYEPDLRPLTGLDRPSSPTSTATGALADFYERLEPLLDFLLPQYVAEGKSHLTVGDRLHGRPPPLGRDRRAPRRRYAERDDAFVEVAHRDLGRG